VLAKAGFAIGGADIRVESTVPLGSGLSSSAALEIALLRAFRDAFMLPIEDVQMALLAKQAENDFVGAPVGVMDQMACTLASDGEALFLDTLDSARSLHVAVTVFATPTEQLGEVRALAGGVATQPQADGDLGERMHDACARLFRDGAGHVVLIGSDLPTLPPSHLSDAFEALEAGADVVLGPAEDGGYYLVGLSRPTPVVFAGISWGTARVLRETWAAAADAGLRVHEVAGWHDVDTPDDLARVAVGREPARRTRQWLAHAASAGRDDR